MNGEAERQREKHGIKMVMQHTETNQRTLAQVNGDENERHTDYNSLKMTTIMNNNNNEKNIEAENGIKRSLRLTQ